MKLRERAIDVLIAFTVLVVIVGIQVFAGWLIYRLLFT